jgi:hypothetical protein
VGDGRKRVGGRSRKGQPHLRMEGCGSGQGGPGGREDPS